MSVLAFLKALFAPGDGYIELRAIPVDKDRESVQADFIPTDRPERWTQRIQSFIKKNPDKNIYFGVATRLSNHNGTLENCGNVRALWVDIDFKTRPEDEARRTLAAFPLAPSITVRSGGGLHCYWLLHEPRNLQHEPKNFRILLRELTKALKADRGSAEPAHVLRVPGTLNVKKEYDPPREVVIEYPAAPGPVASGHEFRLYSLDAFEFLLREPEVERSTPVSSVPLNGDRRRTVSRSVAMERARKYLAAAGGAIQGQAGDPHTYKQACNVRRGFELSDADSFEVMWEWNIATCQPPWDEGEIQEKIQNAFLYGEQPFGGLLNASLPERLAPGQNGNSSRAPIPKKNEQTEPDGEREFQQESSSSAAEIWKVPEHWKRLDLADLHFWDCEPLVPIIDGIIARGNLVYVAAETQTGKTLLSLYIARKLVQGSDLFGKYAITPIERLLYLVLEDPERRARDRLLDTEHEFLTESIDRERCIFHVVPGFKINDDRMFQWLESVIQAEGRNVVFLDTYQKATPGIGSFDDEQQSLILHKLLDLTRRLKITLIVLDHVRKRQNGSKRNDLSIDDIKGTGGKAQNADCVILMERTPDKKQIKFQSLSKDFDLPVRILLNIAPKGSPEPKFTYAGDLEQLGAKSRDRGAMNRNKVLEAMKPGELTSVPALATANQLGRTAVQNHLKRLVADGLVRDNGADGRYKRYERIATLENSKSGDRQKHAQTSCGI